jgi:drug/metabolite transporter (DMT)-like permease
LTRGALLYALIALMIFGWSGNYVAGKIALREFPPLLLTSWRALFAGALILPAWWWERRRGGGRWTWREAPALLALGLLGVTLNQTLFVFGLSRTSVAHAAIFANLTPITVLLLASAGGLERFTAGKLGGMAVALGGVALLKTLEPHARNAPAASLAGDLLIFAGGLAFALFTVFGKPVTKRHSAITVNTFAYVAGALVMAPVAAWQSARFPMASITLKAWGALLFMALFSSVISYLIYYWALGRMAPSQISKFSYFQPPAATALGVIVLGEQVTWALAVSAAVIFAGVFLTERAR